MYERVDFAFVLQISPIFGNIIHELNNTLTLVTDDSRECSRENTLAPQNSLLFRQKTVFETVASNTRRVAKRKTRNLSRMNEVELISNFDETRVTCLLIPREQNTLHP